MSDQLHNRIPSRARSFILRQASEIEPVEPESAPASVPEPSVPLGLSIDIQSREPVYARPRWGNKPPRPRPPHHALSSPVLCPHCHALVRMRFEVRDVDLAAPEIAVGRESVWVCESCSHEYPERYWRLRQAG